MDDAPGARSISAGRRLSTVVSKTGEQVCLTIASKLYHFLTRVLATLKKPAYCAVCVIEQTYRKIEKLKTGGPAFPPVQRDQLQTAIRADRKRRERRDDA
jgi:hypothetical protein